MEIRQPRYEINDLGKITEVPERVWNIEKDQWTLIEKTKQTTCTLGLIRTTYEGYQRNSAGGIILEMPFYRLRVENINGIDFPVICKVNADPRRSFRTIDRISTTPEEILTRLPKIHPTYSTYVEFIKQAISK